MLLERYYNALVLEWLCSNIVPTPCTSCVISLAVLSVTLLILMV